MALQTQPSAQGIASLYMGNPGALQQRVKKEEQAKPGLPPDLSKLMALNIVTNEEDAAKRQQALNAVQQASGPTGQMPTVAQSIQEQAKQKVQAQMLQQQRQQMAMQELAKRGGIADGIPENVPQPEKQPQGIDQLPVDMEFAGGGIVAFAEGDEVLKKIKSEGIAELIPIAENLKEAQAGLVAAARSGDPEAVRKYSQDQAAYRQQLDIAAEGRFGNQAPDIINTLLAPKKAEAAPAAPAATPTPAPAAPAAPASDENAILGRTPSALRTQLNQTISEKGKPVTYYSAPKAETYQYYDPSGELMIMSRGENQSDEDWARQKKIHGAINYPTSQGPGDRIVPRRPVVQKPISDLKAAAQATPPTAPGAAPAAQGLGALLEQGIREDLGRKRDTEAQAMMDKQKQIMGMDKYQQLIDTIIQSKKAAGEKSAAERTPAFIEGLAGLGGTPVRGGLGMMLAQAGTAAGKARALSAEEDKKLADELDTLRLGAAKAQMEGNTALAKTYAEAYKEVDAVRRAALQSGAALEGTREAAASRRQVAAMNAQQRADVAEERARQAGDKLTEQKVKVFTGRDDVKRLLEQIAIFDLKKNPKQEDIDRKKLLVEQLSTMARGSGVDPAIFGISAPSKVDSVSAPPPGAVREIKK